MDSQSVSSVPDSILAEVEKANALVTGQRRFLEQPYFSFIHDLLAHPPIPVANSAFHRETWLALAAVAAPPKEGKDAVQVPDPVPLPAEMEQDAAVLAAQTAAVFVWESWTRARQQAGEHRVESLNLWVDGALNDLFCKNVPVCAWVVWQMLTRRYRWFRYFLLDCEDQYVRAGFIRWLSTVAQTLYDAERASGTPLMLRTLPLPDEAGVAPPPDVAVGLVGKLIDAIMSMFEVSRACWRRFNEYFVMIRNLTSLSDELRVHVACGLYPSYTRPMHPLALYVDYFMGEFSPFVRELPYDRQDRTPLGSKIHGESADLRSFFWAMHDVVRCLDVGAAINYPGRLVVPSKLDIEMWEKQDMLASLIKQGYNPEANALLIGHFCCEHKRYTIMFAKMVGDCYYRESSGAVFEVLLHLLTIGDSFRLYRIETLLHGFLTVLAERKLQNVAGIATQLMRLFSLFETDPIIVSYMMFSRHFWEPFMFHYVGKEKQLCKHFFIFVTVMFLQLKQFSQK